MGEPALRAEDYSDFGRQRLRQGRGRTLRLHRGVRAARLRADGFSRAVVATAVLCDDVDKKIHRRHCPFDITSFPSATPSHAPSRTDLDAEEATNYSFGAVMRFADVSLTIDTYRIDIDDRIVLSENLTQDNVGVSRGQGFIGIGGGRFFINGVDTETRGVDVVFTWRSTRTGRPIRHDDRGEPQRHRCHARAGDRTARAEIRRRPVHSSQRADLRRGQPGQQARPQPEAGAATAPSGQPSRRDALRRALDPDPRLTGTTTSTGAGRGDARANVFVDVEGRSNRASACDSPSAPRTCSTSFPTLFRSPATPPATRRYLFHGHSGAPGQPLWRSASEHYRGRD